MKRKSFVAGIIDVKGGLRVVVTQRSRMKYHVVKGEKLFIVPKLRVQEPVPLPEAVAMIEQVKNYVTEKNK